MHSLVVVGIGLTLLGLVPRVDAVVCRTRAGAVVLRDACGAREEPIDLAVAGPPGPQGAPGAGGPAGAPTVRIVDAEGREVGPAVQVDWYLPSAAPGAPYLYVALHRDPVDGGAALLGVDYAGQPAGTLFYVSDDCTGPPLVYGGTFLPVLEVIGDTVFAPGPPATSQKAGSTETAGAPENCPSVTPRGGCCRTNPVTIYGLVFATTTAFETLGITSPFRAVGP